MEPDWIGFEHALRRTEQKRRHLLLGNGFSISAHSGFGYHRLYDEATRYDAGLSKLFRGQEPDFEKALALAENDAELAHIRSAFIASLVRIHPKIKFLTPEAREICGAFLEPFAGRITRERHPGSVFTTNYDLMLYWVLMANHSRLNLYDGFDNFGLWDETRVHKSSIFYLHGALHHFESQVGRVRIQKEQRKLLWREGASLILQVRDNVERGFFPVFVSEGDAAAKRQRIRNNRYLRIAGRHFRRLCAEPGTAIFTFGHSLAEVDAHITDMIGQSSGEIFLGVYRPKDDGRHATEIALSWTKRAVAEGRQPPLVFLYDTSECRTWAP